MAAPPQSDESVQHILVPQNPVDGSVGHTSGQQLLVELTSETVTFLTTNSVNHIQMRLSDFAKQVLQEARAIEKTEHVGKGSPEITAAHIDEAWWVTRRRIRRARHPALMGLCRIVEGFGTLAVSVGATNLKSTWGIALFVGSVLVTATAYVVELQLARSD